MLKVLHGPMPIKNLFLSLLFFMLGTYNIYQTHNTQASQREASNLILMLLLGAVVLHGQTL